MNCSETNRGPFVRLAWNEEPAAACRGGAVSIGNFDGVHRGHAALVQALVREARRVGGPAVILSFDPHPLQLLAPERFMPVLTAPADRADFLLCLGVDQVVYLHSSDALLRLTAEEFFDRIVHGGFAPRAIVEGFNFCFGRDRKGDNDTLARLCRLRDVAFQIVPPFELDGAPVSSSRVRSALLAGEVRDAGRLLGRNYRIRGVVARGDQRGRTLGFPTLNLNPVEMLLPGDGVYAVRATTRDGRHAGAANVGPNPTFGQFARKIEVHLLDFEGDLYGQEITVEFVERLRGTHRFRGPEELVRQMHDDVAAARKILEESLRG